jgi:lipopolysaccharide biosynthesis regulator YciM
MDIWLFLLILSAILIGWLLGRWQPFKKSNAQHSDLFTEKYASGLNYLLSDDSDNAIKIFTDLVDVNKETIGEPAGPPKSYPQTTPHGHRRTGQ